MLDGGYLRLLPLTASAATDDRRDICESAGLEPLLGQLLGWRGATRIKTVSRNMSPTPPNSTELD